MSNLEIGNQIKLRRKTLRIKQAELANLADVSINTLYKIERGQANPALDTLKKIADILGMEVTMQVKKLKDTD